jgi:proline iminopeptidase
MEAKRSGVLSVGGGHKIYWEDWGNPKAKVPIFFLHGGPGDRIRSTDILAFDLTRQRVILFDQRGAGKSKPYVSTENNTTQDLIADIDKLRKNLNIGVVSLAGGSWGSTLAICYAIANPEVVQKMTLWGIFLGRKTDIEYLNQGKGQQDHFPDVWQRYVEMVPEIERHNTIAYYAKQFDHRDKAVRQRYVNEWALFESSLLSLDNKIDQKIIEQQNQEDFEENLAIAKLEAHYFLNNFFIDDNYIINNAKAIRHIPIILIQGRYDFICPPSAAFELNKALGENSYLHLLPSNHSKGDAVLREVVKAYCRTFLL